MVWQLAALNTHHFNESLIMPSTSNTLNSSFGTRFGFTQKAAVYEDGTAPIPLTTTPYDNSSVFPVRVHYRVWNRTPGFRALMKAGARLPDNPFYLSKSSYQANMFCVRQTRTMTKIGVSGYSFTASLAQVSLRLLHTPPTSLPGTMYASDFEMATALLNKIKSAEFSAPVFVAEGRKTLELVLNTAKSLSDAIRAARKGNLPALAKSLGLGPPSRSKQKKFQRAFHSDPSKAAANAWLQYKYGWKPLLKDVKDAAETFAEAVLAENYRLLGARVTIPHKKGFLETVTGSLGDIGNFSVKKSYHGVASRRYKVAYILKPIDLPGSLGLLNPAEVLWELVPFSFIADWFLPIGEYFHHLGSSLRYDFVSGLTTYHQVIEGIAWSESPDSQAVGGPDSYKTIQMSAEKLTSLPTPSLSGIRFKANLNLAKYTTTLSLLRQNASRLHK